MVKNNTITFKSKIIELFGNNQPDKIAVLPTTEYEGIFRNGGVGTYYKNLAKRLNSQGWYVILIFCDFESDYAGNSDLPEIKHIFTPDNIEDVLNLDDSHCLILEQIKNEWVDSLGYRSLFFIQAILNHFPSSKVYVEFHEMLGVAYYTVQAKQSNLLNENCAIAVTMHSGHEWIYEANEKYNLDYPEWLWKVAHNEQSCFENADLSFFPSYYLTTRVQSYGWNIQNGHNMPNYIPIVNKNTAQKSTD